MNRERGTVVILGALGLLGRAALDHFVGRGWTAVGVARRRPDFATPARFVSLDLRDADACRRDAEAFRGATHVVYAALYEKPDLIRGWRERDQIETNLTMLRNAVEAVASVSPELRHISLLQGTKAYGIHVEPRPLAGKERWPRHPHENFYWEQEDWLRARSAAAGWSFTILRPQAVLGHAIGSPMNVVAAIGAYAAIMRELGRPLAYPGGGRFVASVTDSNLFAKALEWAATEPRCAGETYNITNGDALVWQDIWPSVAEAFGMPAGAHEPASLAETMPQHAALWERMAERHGLRSGGLNALIGSSWQFADRTLAQGLEHPPSVVLSTIKARGHGFDECMDSEESLVGWLRRLQDERVLPR